MQETENRPDALADNPQPVATDTRFAVPQAVANNDQAVEIAQLCQLAGMSDKTAEFLSSGQSVTQVRQALLTAKAKVPAISGHLAPAPSSQPTDLLMKVMKQRTGKES